MIWLRSPCVPNRSASFPSRFRFTPLRASVLLRSVNRNRSGNWLRDSPHTPFWPNHSRSGQIDPDRSSGRPNSKDSYNLLDLARFGVFAGSDLESIWPISVQFGRRSDLARFLATYSKPIFPGKAPGQIDSILNRFGQIS